jgi:hypothetical protein
VRGPPEQQADETELQWLQQILPREFYNYADVFSKEASNVLLPHRPYNHKIVLTEPNGEQQLGFSPLYHQSTAELEEVKSTWLRT